MKSKASGYPIDQRFTGGSKPNQDRRIEALGGVALFSGLSRRNLTRIDRIGTVRYASKGDVLMQEGEPGDEMMVVVEGRATVSRRGRQIAECTVGMCMGEMSLLDDQVRSATVVAANSMQLVVIQGDQFRTLLTKIPPLTHAVLATLSNRLREAQAVDDF